MTTVPEPHLGPFMGQFGPYSLTPQDLQGVRLFAELQAESPLPPDHGAQGRPFPLGQGLG